MQSRIQNLPMHPNTERFLDAIPGLLVWGAFIGCFLGAFIAPLSLLTIVAILALYTASRFIIAAVASRIGLRRIRQWEMTDWRQHYDQYAPKDALPWEAVHHVVLIPNYNEPIHVLRRTLTYLAKQYQATSRITIVLAMEGSEANSDQKAQQLVQEFDGQFAHIFYTIHPRGLSGELAGKSSNIAWAGRWVKRELVENRGYSLDHILVTTMDADTLWHPQHFYALTCFFAINPYRHQRMFQAVIRYHGNIWTIHPFLRLINAYSTGFELAYLAAWWWTRLPISSYAVSLKLLDDAFYWDTNVIADEWRMFIKAFYLRHGNFKVEPIFLPFLADAATGETWWKAFKARYTQTLRHAWGSKEMGVVINRWMNTPEMPFWPTLRLLMRVSHDILLAGAGWVIITVGSQLPFLFHPHLIPFPPHKALEHPVFLAMGISSIIIIVVSLLFWRQDVSVRPPRPNPPTLRERFMALISFPLLPILTLFFLALPVIQAQTKLMLGSGLEFRVTQKF